MSDFIDGFLGEGVDITQGGYEPQTITVKIEKITREKNFEFAPGYKFDDAVVYHFVDQNKKKFTKADSLLKANGTPKKANGMFMPMRWYDGRVIRATASYDIQELVKEALGEEKYEKLKKENGDKVSHKILIGVKFDIEYAEGEKDGEKYRVYSLPSESLFKYIKYLHEKEGRDLESIPEVRELPGFEKENDNSLAVKSTLIDDDLPF